MGRNGRHVPPKPGATEPSQSALAVAEERSAQAQHVEEQPAAVATEGAESDGGIAIRGRLDGRLPPGAYHVEGPVARERRLRGQSGGALTADSSRNSDTGSGDGQEEGTATSTAATTIAHEAVVTDAVAIPVDDDDEEAQRRSDDGESQHAAVISAVMDSEAIAQHEQRLVEQTREETKRELAQDSKRRTWLLGGGILFLLMVVAISVSVAVVSRNNNRSTAPSNDGGMIGPAKCPGNKIVTDSIRQGDQFGYAIDLAGDTMLVGAPFSSPHGEESGTAYILRRKQQDNNTWQEEARIIPNGGVAGDKFGVKLALNEAGDVAAISADQVDQGKGAVYLFSRSVSNPGSENRNESAAVQWTLQAKLTADDATDGAQFGDSVDIYGNTIVVGASYSDHQSGVTGAVYVFEKDGGSGSWAQTDKLLPSDGNVNSTVESIRFGRSVALAGENVLVVGADKDDPNGQYSGSAYIFRRTIDPGNNGQPVWLEEAKLIPDDGGISQYFGYHVDIDASGSTVVVSCWKDGKVVTPATEEKTAKTEQIGSAYVFAHDTSLGQWTQQAKIIADDGEPGDRFGNSVSINGEGDTLLIGAYTDDERRGSAYVFLRSNDDGDASSSSWRQTMKLRPADVNAVEEFAMQVVLDGTTAAISEDRDIDNGYEAGAMHVYGIDECLSEI